jgi:hypothetical protein
MPESGIKVTIEGQGSVVLNENEISSGQTGQFELGSLVELTAQPGDLWVFAYWQDEDSKSIISFEPVYKCLVGTAINIRAVFKETVTEETDAFIVTFVDKGGNILESQQVTKNGSATAPEGPALPGYIFAGWDRGFDNVTDNLVIAPLYQREANEYTLTVVGGTLTAGDGAGGETSGSFKSDIPVTVEADPASGGQKFSHWELDGVKVSTNESYSFFTPMKDADIKAVYADENEVVTDAPFIAMYVLKDTDEAVSYTVHRNVPVGYTLVQSGVILKSGDPVDELTLDTQGAIIGRIINSSTDQFYIYKNKGGSTWQARAYLIYQDQYGNIVTVYSE